MKQETVSTQHMLFFRRTKRYGKLGSIARNRGFLKVKRCSKTGRFVSNKAGCSC